MKQATKEALAWLAADANRTPYKAAQKFHISQSTLTRVLRKEAAKSVCPHCGSFVYHEVSALPKGRSGKVDMGAVLGVMQPSEEDLA